jgi:hypothetical protein
MRNFFLLSVFLPVCLFSQVTEDFSDGDFTSDPAWNGDLSHFKLSSSSAIPSDQHPALQLDAPAAGISSLTVPVDLTGDLEWTFWVKHSFNSSASNYSRIYLLADRADLVSPLKGYFLQIGGGADSVDFYRTDSLDEIRLLRLDSVYTGNSTNSLRFRIMRSKEGKWEFYTDDLGGQSFVFQGETGDLSTDGGNCFGFRCNYTSSNATKFYFDDIYAGPLIIDSVPPALLKADVITSSEILLEFSEALNKAMAEDIMIYEMIPGIGNPNSAIQLPDLSRIHLFFDNEMEKGIEYTLQISDMADIAGNKTGPISRGIRYYPISPYDLIITEIMADPSPPFDLPEYEYLEICNRSPVELNIEGLILKIGGNEHLLPSQSISPGGYLVLCDDDAVDIMQHLATVAGLPSFSLPNSGTDILLSDTSGQAICYLAYDFSWYADDDKSDGGWSLEMIDQQYPCKNEENWAASISSSGGTPGSLNSHHSSQNGEFRILRLCSPGESEIEIEFNESLDSLIASDTNRYLASPFLGYPSVAAPVPPGFRSVRLQFPETMMTGQVYRLTVFPGLANCTGEGSPAELGYDFAVAQAVDPFDIIINEILFNPAGDGEDYVEIYNRSSKAIDLNGLFLASVKDSPTVSPDTQSVCLATHCNTLMPYHFLALSTDQQTVKSQFYTDDPSAFLDMASFPSFNNDEGRVLLMTAGKTVIDGMDYNEEMHFLMLGSAEGVALERICTERLGYEPGNWHSAAETVGFGTPGYQNSQYLEVVEDDESVSLQPEVFSPDGDGRDDQLGIVYNFDSPGKLLSVLIFNADGRLARTLVNNEMPGTQGIYTWDGTMDDRTPAQSGVYVVYLETLAMDGKTSRYKKAAVLTRNR